MEVTRSNFKNLLPEIKAVVDNCTFIAIDCELTGLNTCNEINGYDTQSLYYEKLCRAMKNFLVIQYGLCAFRYDEDNDVFKQVGYNFYIFRRPVNRNVPDVRFMCQSSSIEFLSSQGFDFNKLFKEGISYLNINEEQKYRQNLQDSEKLRANSSNAPQDIIPISNEDKPFIDKIVEKIENFIESEEIELMLPKCNAFLRRLIYQTAQTKFADKVILKTKQLENKDRILFVTKFKGKEELKKEENKRIEEERELLEEVIGFSKVVKYIVNSGKLVIGHNMCLDLLHTIDKFLTPLPKEYTEFKECVSCLFTRILDTKFMSSLAPFKELIASNVLSHLIETVTKEPFTLPTLEVEESKKGYSLSNVKEHEAGYDAFVTGLSFLAMWKYLGDQMKGNKQNIFKNFSLLKPYINKLYVMKIFDGLYINLGGVDLKPKRNNVLYITFPKDWKLNNIIQLFSPFGPVNVAWIDDQSAYVGLQKEDQLHVALKTLSQSDTYKIMTYEKRQAALQGLQQKHCMGKTNSNKRSLQESDDIVKKRRAVSLGENTAVPSVEIERSEVNNVLQKETDDIGVPIKRANRKRTISKTFEESSSWD